MHLAIAFKQPPKRGVSKPDDFNPETAKFLSTNPPSPGKHRFWDTGQSSTLPSVLAQGGEARRRRRRSNPWYLAHLENWEGITKNL